MNNTTQPQKQLSECKAFDPCGLPNGNYCEHCQPPESPKPSQLIECKNCGHKSKRTWIHCECRGMKTVGGIYTGLNLSSSSEKPKELDEENQNNKDKELLKHDLWKSKLEAILPTRSGAIWRKIEIHDFVGSLLQAKERVERQKTQAEERLRAFEILGKYALMTVKPESLDLIEQAQQEILSNDQP